MPEPFHLPFWGGLRTIVKRDAMLIRLKTDLGLIGYAPGPAHEQARSDINGPIRSFLLGKDPLRWNYFQFHGNGHLKKSYAAVEIALMDLVGKYEGTPVSEIVGGRMRHQIKVYGSAGMYMKPEGFAEEAARMMEWGFPAYKMRPALGPENDLKTVELMREATHPEFGLMIDAHSWWRMGDKSYHPDEIIDLAREIGRLNPVWLEEPFPPDDHEAYQRLTASGLITVATGEHEQNLSGYLDLIERGGAHYLQMDVCCQGGFSMGRHLFTELSSAGLKFAFHSWGTDLEVIAAAHLGICWPEEVVEWMEYPVYTSQNKKSMYPFPLAAEILSEPLNISAGYLDVSDQPGLGVEINENIITNYPYIPGPWSYFYLDSPKETVAVTGDHSIKWIL